MRVGNHLVTILNSDLGDTGPDVWTAAFHAPLPNGFHNRSVVRYWEGQAEACLNASAKTEFNSGDFHDGDLYSFLRSFVELYTFRDVAPKVYLLTLVSLERVMELSPINTLTGFNYPRLVLGAFIVALKYDEGDSYKPRDFGSLDCLTGTKIDEVEGAFRRALSGFDLSEEDSVRTGYSAMLEAFDSPFRDIVLTALHQANVRDLDDALLQFREEVDRRTPPQAIPNPLRVGETYHDIHVYSFEQAELLNERM